MVGTDLVTISRSETSFRLGGRVSMLCSVCGRMYLKSWISNDVISIRMSVGGINEDAILYPYWSNSP